MRLKVSLSSESASLLAALPTAAMAHPGHVEGKASPAPASSTAS